MPGQKLRLVQKTAPGLKQIISLNCHITRHTTPNIIFGLSCVYSSVLKLEILHPNSHGTPKYTISQRSIHTTVCLTNNTGQTVEYRYLIQRKPLEKVLGHKMEERQSKLGKAV